MKMRMYGFACAVFSLTALGSMALPLSAMAQEGPDTSASAIPNTPVTLNLESTDLYYALKLLFNQIKAPFVLDNSLKGTLITVSLPKVPFRIALENILKASGLPLTYRYENGIYSVVPIKESDQRVQPEEREDLIPQNKPVLEKIYVSVTDVAEIANALGFALIRSNIGVGGRLNNGQGGFGAVGPGGFGNANGFPGFGNGLSGFGTGNNTQNGFSNFGNHNNGGNPAGSGRGF